MNCISDFFRKFIDLEKNNDTKISIVLETVEKFTNIRLKKEDLEIKRETLKLKVNPVVQNEIFMHLPQIQDALKQQKIFLKIV